MKVLRSELNVDETRTNADWNSYFEKYNSEPVMVDYGDWDNGNYFNYDYYAIVQSY